MQLAQHYSKNLSSAFWQQQMIRTGSSVSMAPKLHLHLLYKTLFFHLLFTAVNRPFFLCLNQNTFNLDHLCWFTLTLHKARLGAE